MSQAKITVQIHESNKGIPPTAGDMKLILDDGRELYFFGAQLVFKPDNLTYVKAELLIENIKVVKAPNEKK
jgi:hypothetical protein